MARKSNISRILVLLLVVIAGAVLAYAWIRKHRQAAETPAAPLASVVPVGIRAEKIDPANEGKAVELSGELKVLAPAHDTQLGIEADAVILMRYADMLQWQEQCTGTNCSYRQVWSPQLISSKKFRVPEGHQNPTRMPVTTARYSADDVRLGAFRIDAAALANSRLGAVLPIKPVRYPVSGAKLPSNIAITFRELDGMLYAGDPAHRAVGDLRVIYRIIPAAKVEITGIQRGDAVIVKTVKENSPPS